MKSKRDICAALMLSAAMTFGAPAMAQDATAAQQVTPPPVAATLSQGGTPASQSATPVNPEAAAQAEAEDAERAAERRAARPERRAAGPVAARTVTRAPVTRAAPAAQAPAASPAAPAATAAAPEATTPAPAEEARTTTTTTQADQGGAPLWPLGLIGALIVAAGAFFFMRRRRAQEDVWAGEPAYAEPEYVERDCVEPAPVVAPEPAPVMAAAPVAAAPAMAPRHDPVSAAAPAAVAAGEIRVERADHDEVAALTGAMVEEDRPWLEFAMRPVRAGTSAEEAMVEIELTVGNTGGVAAENVRISTFMLAAGNDSEMERLLIDPRDDAAAERLTIPAGEGARVEATLSMSRSALGGGDFRPVIVADARYRLPDGSEGRTSASFLVGGATEAGGPAPIDLDHDMIRDDVEAALYREPARA